MLDPSYADAVAAAFGLGGPARLAGPVAFGRLGEIWRLDTEQGAFAVKQWRSAPDREGAERDAAYQERVRAAGLAVPTVVRARDGRVVAEVNGVPVRVHTWVEVAPEDRRLDPVAVGRAVATLHRVHLPAGGPVEDWYAAPVGRDAWRDLLDRLAAAGAGFAGRLADLVPDLGEVEGVLVAPTSLQTCHRDLWADNVRAAPDGSVVVLDWENCGPGSPSQELGVVAYEYGCGERERVRALVRAYEDAGGPGRLRRPADLTMLVAQQLHILQIACERWLRSTTAADRADNAAWACEFLDDPVTSGTVDWLLASA